MSDIKQSHLVITVHGIQTFGDWQGRFKKILQEYDSQIEVENYQYGYFSVLAFLIPILRSIVTRRFRTELLSLVTRKQPARLDIVAHSFGTHIVAWALRSLPESERPTVHTLILAGSVLRVGFPWRNFVPSSVGRLINECGIEDSILVLNQFCVLFTGIAGRAGFIGFNGTNLTNRHFGFGHSGYFVGADGTPNDSFMIKHWLSLLTEETSVPLIDERTPPKFITGIKQVAINNAEPIKVFFYGLIMLLIAKIFLAAWDGRIQQQTEDRRLHENLGRFELELPEGLRILSIRRVQANQDPEDPWLPGAPLNKKSILFDDNLLGLQPGYFVLYYGPNEQKAYPLGLYSRGFETNEIITVPAPENKPGYQFIAGGVVPIGDFLNIGEPREHPVVPVRLRPFLIQRTLAGIKDDGYRFSWSESMSRSQHLGNRLPSSAEWEWAMSLGEIEVPETLYLDWSKLFLGEIDSPPARNGQHEEIQSASMEWTISRNLPPPYDPDDGRESPYALDSSRIAKGSYPHFYNYESQVRSSWAFSRPSLFYVWPIQKPLHYRMARDVGSARITRCDLLTKRLETFTDHTDWLTPSSLQTLRQIAMILAPENTKITVEGHSWEIGTWEYNHDKGERVARAVSELLVLEGVDRDRIEIISYGEERPASRVVEKFAGATIKLRGELSSCQ